MEPENRLNVENYPNGGWGLSHAALKALMLVMDSLPEICAIEFGSGGSTQFLLDYAASTQKNIRIDSFDNDPKYKHPTATLVDLVTCKQKYYDAMFAAGEINWAAFSKRWRKPKSRQKNCFYDIRNYPLKSKYNLAIVDGPHGNGRNFAYLILKNRMKDGFILIDDFNHYDFVETASSIFDLEEIERVELPKDNFVLMRIRGLNQT